MAMNNGMRRPCPQERMQCSQERMQFAQERMQCPQDRMSVQVSQCDKKAIMRCVYETGFVSVETMLYLDTHPEDREALAYFAQMKEQYKKCVKQYNEICGPLRFTDVNDENYWTWVMTPMPWEMEG